MWRGMAVQLGWTDGCGTRGGGAWGCGIAWGSWVGGWIWQNGQDTVSRALSRLRRLGKLRRDR